MIKKTIEISQQPAYLSVRNGQLLIHARGDGEPLIGQAPCEDIGVLLVDQPAVTYSHAALTTLLKHDVAVVLCGHNHLPVGMLLPLGDNVEVVRRIRTQVSASRPLVKRLWRQIVQAKIRAQAMNLPDGVVTRAKLLGLARSVRSGDPTNVEAQAARAYWPAWTQLLSIANIDPAAPIEFRRNPDGPPPNNLLNYGYAVMRAAVARAIVAAGLLPAIGLHHHHRSNAFCLADDLVEPLRPVVDSRAAELVRDGHSELTPDVKRGLLELLTVEVQTGDQTGPLTVALHRYAASLVKCFEGRQESLDIPVPASTGEC